MSAGSDPASIVSLRRICPGVPLIAVFIAEPNARGTDGARAGESSREAGVAHVFNIPTPNALVAALRRLSQKTAKTAQKSGSVLSIDDDEAMRSLAEQLSLEDAGYAVVVAADRIKGLEALRTSPIDIILVDMRMPGLSGADVCRRVQADPSTTELPVLVVMGIDALGEKLSAFDAGANDFLSKPYGDEELVGKVARLISMAESRHMANRIGRTRR